MKTKRTFAALLSFLLLAAPAAQAQFNYATNNGTITITGYIGPGGTVTIPATITGLPVARIEELAFNYHTNLTGVTIPDHVTSIGEGAFAYCLSLASINIPSSVTSMEYYAFYYCTSLTNIIIPANVTSIQDETFEDCTSLISVTIPDSVSSIGYEAFKDCISLTSVRIPNGVTSFGFGVFEGCTSLTNATIPNSITGMGGGTFADCISLTSITIANGVTTIGTLEFAGCSSLTSITIPSSITRIGAGAFGDCTNLTSAFFMGDVPRFDFSYYPVFDSDNNVTVYYLPGTSGWDTYLGGAPTVLWLPQVQTDDANFGVRTSQFGFNINWASGQTVVVEACPDLSSPVWTPVGTNTLTSGSSYFSEPQWKNYASRFYRLRLP